MSADQTDSLVRSIIRFVSSDSSIPPRFKIFHPRLSALIRGKKSRWLVAICYLPAAFFSSRHTLTAFTN
jgi:hypothetical protein